MPNTAPTQGVPASVTCGKLFRINWWAPAGLEPATADYDVGRRSVYEPGRTVIDTDEARVLDSGEDPRPAFAGHVRETQRDDDHLIYFSGYVYLDVSDDALPVQAAWLFDTEVIEPWKTTNSGRD